VATIPTADRGKATVKVRIALKVKDPRIVPDMGVTVSFLEQAPEAGDEQPRAGVRVPSGALVERDGRTVAFVLGDDDRVRLRQVQAVPSTASTRDVTSGLAQGELVVLDPPQDLADGDLVKLAGGGWSAAPRPRRPPFPRPTGHACTRHSHGNPGFDPQPDQDLPARPGEGRSAA